MAVIVLLVVEQHWCAGGGWRPRHSHGLVPPKVTPPFSSRHLLLLKFTLTVSGRGLAAAMPSTSRPNLRGLFKSLAPRPRRVASYIGHPQLRSTHCAPHFAATCDQ
eukprot:1179668-Prorocentrum_minimum.AAC.2